MTREGFHPTKKTDLPRIGVGMLGYGFMGKAHTNAFRTLPYIFWPPPAYPDLVAICGRTEKSVAEAAAQYEYAGYYVDWRKMIEDDRIQLFDNCAWHSTHVEPCIAALEAGKHVLCEKPLAENAREARLMRDAAVKTNLKHMCAFNYRFAPANRLARNLIENGHLGRIYMFRVRYLQEHGSFPASPYRAYPGKAGVLLGLGSHAIDMARYLVGEPASVHGTLRTFVESRAAADGGLGNDSRNDASVKMVDDDTAVATMEFEGGAIGTMEASYTCRGRKNQFSWEIHGENGSMQWDLEDLNRLHVHLHDEKAPNVKGFENVLVTEGHHELMERWWPHGHILSWEHLHTNMIHHLVDAIAHDKRVGPHGATFEDGYRAAVVSDCIEQSFQTGRRVAVNYENPPDFTV